MGLALVSGVDKLIRQCYTDTMRQKMLKMEKGSSKPVEKQVDNAAINEEANKWIAKIDEASNVFGADVNFKIKAASEVLKEMADKITSKELSFEVLTVVLRRRNLKASVDLLSEGLSQRLRNGNNTR